MWSAAGKSPNRISRWSHFPMRLRRVRRVGRRARWRRPRTTPRRVGQARGQGRAQGLDAAFGGEGRGQGQHSGHQPRVVQLAREDPADQVRERDAGDLHVGLLLGDLVPLPLGLRQIPREEDPDGLVGSAGRGEEVGQHPPLARLGVRLLVQLPLGRAQRVLTGYVQQPGRELPQPVPHGVAELLEDQHPLLLVEGEDAHRARVHLVVAAHHRAVGHPDLVRAHGRLRALERCP